MTDFKLAVIGDPVAHSASPRLHRAFLAAAGRAGTYEAIRVAAGAGARAIADLRAAGYTGLNVTTPLKEEAFAASEVRDAAAVAAGSVNTLVLGDRISGYNTDGLGAVGALAARGLVDLAGRRILVLGAGPTARSCLAGFVARGARTFVWNRTASKAAGIADALGAHLWPADDAAPDAVLAALPPNALPDDPALLKALLAAPIVIDANYGERATLGHALGRDVTDGSEMLRASARASFDLFTSCARSTA
jgi:shikimate dehydrogenase